MYGMRVDMKNIDDPYLSRRYEFLPAPSFLAWGGQMGEVNGSFSFLTSTTFEKSESQEDVGLASRVPKTTHEFKD